MPVVRQGWVQVQVRFRAEDEAELRRIAEAEGRSTGNLLRLLARRYIEKHREGLSEAPDRK